MTVLDVVMMKPVMLTEETELKMQNAV